MKVGLRIGRALVAYRQAAKWADKTQQAAQKAEDEVGEAGARAAEASRLSCEAEVKRREARRELLAAVQESDDLPDAIE